MACLAFLFAAWLAWCALVIVYPSVQRVTTADAVIALGPLNSEDRIDTALALVREGVSKNLVLSVAPGDNHMAPLISLCAGTYLPGVHVTCFRAAPETTQGEARQIRVLAKQHDWSKIAVVTSRYHVSRARTLIERCFSGSLAMVAPSDTPSILGWGYQFLYQTVAYVKVYSDFGC